MSNAYTPKRGRMEFEPDYKPKPRTVHEAILNPLAIGTRVHIKLEGTELTGAVKWFSQEHGTMSVEKQIWRNGHYLGTFDLRVDFKLGWSIEVIDAGAELAAN